MISCLPSTPEPLLTDAAGDHRLRPYPTGPRPPAALRLLNETRTLSQLKQAHAHILRHGLAHHPVVVGALLRLYSSHHRLDLASAVFSPNTMTASTFQWNLMIRAYVSNGSPLEALRLYNLLISRGCPTPDKFTFPFAIAACSALAHLPKGMELHALAIKAGFSDDTYVQNALIHLYLTCSTPDYARRVFDGMPVRTVGSWTALISGLVGLGDLDAAKQAFDAAPVKNVVTWTAMIDGCARNGRPEEAFELFQSMQAQDVRPNAFTVVALLIACNELGSLHLGRWVHDYARAHDGLGLARNVYVCTALIDMYSKCGSIEDAVKVFDEMPVRSLATWNSMISSLGVHGQGHEAIRLFREMEESGLKPDRITFVGVLCACARAGMTSEGCELFRYMVRQYGIVPRLEHFKSMAEVLGSAIHSSEDEIVELVSNLIVEMDDAGMEMLLRACRDYGDVMLEGVVSSCIHEVEVSRKGSTSEAQMQHHCFSWEVG
ncbi:hypothetical protein J5N97_016595 [Dioscorea zingiberensis]|uniref:Pentatricopeptide repeat-containing protein n=1 Tax=Dioscorea zingiberensis TaxID=325984 RepID=A0A9D5CK96_9LILI|nr:hypothetical protein J5N97_016595 [Dioscorea zingiberensis]